MAESRYRGLGRLHAPDVRDQNYPMRALLAAPEPLVSRTWRTVMVRDQGQTSQCVGYGWRGWMDCAPIMDSPRVGIQPTQIYVSAQLADEWAPTPHDGTSVRAAAKVLQTAGLIASYHWAQSLVDVQQWLCQQGPVVLGTLWTEAMFTPDDEGFVTPDGPLVGGHCYLAVGISVKRQAVRCVNSWGRGWGESGRFWLRFNDLAGFLGADGEAAAAVEQKLTISEPE